MQRTVERAVPIQIHFCGCGGADVVEINFFNRGGQKLFVGGIGCDDVNAGVVERPLELVRLNSCVGEDLGAFAAGKIDDVCGGRGFLVPGETQFTACDGDGLGLVVGNFEIENPIVVI